MQVLPRRKQRKHGVEDLSREKNALYPLILAYVGF